MLFFCKLCRSFLYSLIELKCVASLPMVGVHLLGKDLTVFLLFLTHLCKFFLDLFTLFTLRPDLFQLLYQRSNSALAPLLQEFSVLRGIASFQCFITLPQPSEVLTTLICLTVHSLRCFRSYWFYFHAKQTLWLLLYSLLTICLTSFIF